MSELSWAATRRLVHERANFCCEYCQTSQKLIGQAMHIEHIDPKGGDHPDNLCLACASCNQSKGIAMHETDPLTEMEVSLFNPRRQVWEEHFEWQHDQTHIKGLSPTGPATAERLKINLERIVIARKVWVRAGEHPPSDRRETR